MAAFTLETINGPAFGIDTYDIESMMQLDAKIAKFYLYFLSIENAKIKKDGKWQSAAVYVSGTHRYIRYRLLRVGESADTGAQTFYQFPEEEFTRVDYSGKEFNLQADPAEMTLTAGDVTIRCERSRDFNICVFSMQVSDHFRKGRKALFEEHTVEGMVPYVYDDHAKRMGLQMDEIRLVAFPISKLGFLVGDEFSDILEKGIMTKADVKLQRRMPNGKIVPANLATVRTDLSNSMLTMTTASNGNVLNYVWEGMENVPMDHGITFYFDKNAKLFCNAASRTLLYIFSAYGRRSIELHFVTDAEYYSVGNLLYQTIVALGGDPTGNGANNGSGNNSNNNSSYNSNSNRPGGNSLNNSYNANTGSSKGGVKPTSLADVEASTKKQEPEVSPLEELKSLVGMEQLKNDVEELISLVRMQKLREEKGMRTVPVTLHLVFTGNPGTGKTTVARILGKLYKEIGALSQGQLVECDRSGLVAGYIGHTAIQTQKKIDEAMGGILFIDEAYTLAKEGNDFGQEAIDTLLKAMEDHRKDFVVIVAGYPDLMQKFINSNPGLKSRFNKYMYFPDYTAEELTKIFEANCKKYDYKMAEEAREAIFACIEKMVEEKDENFANAREVRNLFETIITNHASRVDKIEDPTDEQLVTIMLEDVEAE